MADQWIGLCRDEATEDVRRALRHIDKNALLAFASSPQDMREQVQGSASPMGAIVGPLDGALSPLNVAAALVRDGMAKDVVLVVPGASKGMLERAQRAGVRTIVDLTRLVAPPVADLDEPNMPDDEVPTMVWGFTQGKRPNAQSVPRVEDDAADVLTIPLLRGGAHGPELQSVTIPRQKPPRSDEPNGPETHRRAVLPGSAGVASKGGAPIITFVSGRGGVGKTSLVAMMAVHAASWGMSVALCDLDLSCGNLYSCFGLRGEQDLAAVFLAEHVTDAEIVEAGSRVSDRLALWGPCERPEMAEVVFPKTERLLGVLSQTHDIVLVDTSTTITDAVAQAAQQCDRLVITVDGRPGSAASQARVAALAVRLGVARTRLVRLANRCGPHGRGEPVINRAALGLETARSLCVLDGGSEVQDCLSAGNAADLVDLGSRFSDSSATVLAKMLSELGHLPNSEEAHRALESSFNRPRWAFGRRKEAL